MRIGRAEGFQGAEWLRVFALLESAQAHQSDYVECGRRLVEIDRLAASHALAPLGNPSRVYVWLSEIETAWDKFDGVLEFSPFYSRIACGACEEWLDEITVRREGFPRMFRPRLVSGCGPTLYPVTLEAALAVQASASVAARHTFRACGQCGEWFLPPDKRPRLYCCKPCRWKRSNDARPRKPAPPAAARVDSP